MRSWDSGKPQIVDANKPNKLNPDASPVALELKVRCLARLDPLVYL